MAFQQAPKKEGLREGAIVWLDGRFESEGAKTFSQRYADAQKLLRVASNARSELESSLSFLSGKRADVRKTYSQYCSAVTQLISDVEDAISRMERLRGAFAKTEHKDQLAAYDRQLGTMKERLAELKEDAKWRPSELKGYRPEEIKDVIRAEIASLERRPSQMRIARVEPKKKEMELPRVPAKEEMMVFTEEEVFGKKAPKKGEGMVFTTEEFALQGKIKKLNSEIKDAKEEGDAKKVRALRMERKEAWLKYSEITGEKPPKHVLNV